DVVDVLEDLRLGRIALRPAPLLLELLRERVRVVHALDVAARPRVTVPVPRTADPVADLVHARAETEAAEPVEHGEPGEAGAHHDRVEVGGILGANSRISHRPSSWHRRRRQLSYYSGARRPSSRDTRRADLPDPSRLSVHQRHETRAHIGQFFGGDRALAPGFARTPIDAPHLIG